VGERDARRKGDLFRARDTEGKQLMWGSAGLIDSDSHGMT